VTTTAAVRERPILFSGPMVRAILDGTKTQTRRPIGERTLQGPEQMRCRYGEVGETLWVRERHALLDMRPEILDYDRAPRPIGHCPVSVTWEVDDRSEVRLCPPHEWRESFDADGVVWRPSIHMPRWASRLTLELTDVRVQRVQEISEEDAIAEGCVRFEAAPGTPEPKAAFAALWDSLNAKRGFGWNQNPWVWALTFSVIHPEAAR
jgi:hypothetical protein